MNYRLIGLTLLCCKTMERVILDYLELKNLLATNQFRSRKLRSVEDQLLLTYGEVTPMVDSGYIATSLQDCRNSKFVIFKRCILKFANLTN